MTEKSFVIDMQQHYIPHKAYELLRRTTEYDRAIDLKRLGAAYELIVNIDTHLK